MAPLFPRGFDLKQPFGELRMQWSNPSDVFSVLLLLGGDVVSRALAQLAGGSVTPVTFSFGVSKSPQLLLMWVFLLTQEGWVAYSVAAIVSCVGENRLMPDGPDCQSIVIHGKSGYVRQNTSWILGRVLRDYDHWMPPQAREQLERFVSRKPRDKQASGVVVARAGLFVSVFRASGKKIAGEPERDLVWLSGIIVGIFQLGIACIPFGLYGDWSIFLITAFGIILCFATGALPQWREEKWNCRRNSDHNYILTRGNGAQHAIVVLGGGHGLNFEDLASSDAYSDSSASWLTRLSLLILAGFWIALLIFASGLQQNTWFLLAVGGLGIIHNATVAGAPRRPENFGIHLEAESFIGGPKVMPVLMDTERRYPHVGRSMLQTFFPGKLWAEEEQEWHLFDLEAKAHDAEIKAKRLEDELAAQQAIHPFLRLDAGTGKIQTEEALSDLERSAKRARNNAFALKKTARDAREGSENLKKASHQNTI
ncbi:MAG: hypothetical protein Q9159_002356 [Coniocarpon cinnabarinum]